MSEWKNWLKISAIAALYLLASQWDYEDQVRMQNAQSWARVAHK